MGGEEGQGLSRASCWLQETDPGEALAPVCFSLPLRPIEAGQIPSVASKAIPRAALAPAQMASPLGPGPDVKMDASGPSSVSPPRDSHPPLSYTGLLSSLLFLLFFLSCPPCSFKLPQKENLFLKGGGVSLAFHISVVAVFKVATLPEIPRSSVSSNR